MKRNNHKIIRWKKVGLQSQLLLLEIGGVIDDVIFSGPVWRGYRHLIHKEQWAERSRIVQALYRLEKQGLVQKTGKVIQEGLELTDNGRRHIKRILSDKLDSPRGKPWDGKWHVVIFDIPEHHRLGRDLLRRKLNQLGCHQLQKSVFLYPYDLRLIVERIRDSYDLKSDLIYITADTLDWEQHYQKLFEEKGILPPLN